MKVLDHGYVELLNVSGPVRRTDCAYDGDDSDPALAARVSFDGKRLRDDKSLCDYLWREGHMTPFEMIEIWLEIKLPIFLARQFMRHRTVSINEVSGRYVELPAEWYIPEKSELTCKVADIKQGGSRCDSSFLYEWYKKELEEQCAQSYDRYLKAIEKGISNQHARLFLHLNHYTKVLWKQDLRNMLHFLKLRSGEGAQVEARLYAQVIKKLLSEVLPESIRRLNESR
jgi:thymidylate synthase (FAD)